ncbi:MAG: hypothetical protein P8P25_03735 [Flavobacteriaceae bacterium]|nr:hypothetical protein [Flavobacteriaceae bacterium]MDG1031773.1 hypothetical protein [Flavobacteriaceae bacterium]MDG1343955.1 hypothetical protein [Flavobacteriaceae bacterium]MDG2485204.1 hypothetical protein [Flavobacteriaceae bacterium]
MLKNVSYNNSKIKSEINDVLGNPFTIFERIKLRGVGSPKYIISQTDSIITNLLNLDNNTNQCNIELRPKGIIVSFRSLLETYALIIPFYKLKLFKGQSNVYSIYIDKYFIKILAKNKNEHDFIKKINKFKSTN